MFPNAAIWGWYAPGTAPSAALPRNYTWIAMLLPYLDQGPLYNAINFSLPLYDKSLKTQIDSNGNAISSKKLSVLQCPTSGVLIGPLVSWTNYSGATMYWATGGWGIDPYSGVFTDFQNTGIRDIKDGTTTTIAVGETSSFGFNGNSAWVNGGAASRGSSGNAVMHTALCPAGTVSNYPGTGTVPMWPDNSGTWAWWNNVAPYVTDATYIAIYGINANWPGPSSDHSGGIQVTMADGSVRFINSSIQFQNPSGNVGTSTWNSVWFSLNTRNGVQLLEPPIGDF